MKYPKEVLRKKFEELPQNLQDAIMSFEKSEKIQKIADKFNLKPEQRILLEEVTNVMLSGLEKFSEFRVVLVNELGVNYDQALKISADINTDIFAPVVETLKKMETDNRGTSPQNAPENVLQKQASMSSATFPPKKMLMDHETIEKQDGPHLHSQTLMPTQSATPSRPAFVQNSAPSNIPTGNPKPSFGASIDEKLSQMVKKPTQNITASPEAPKRDVYKGNDPYREPIE